MTDTDLKRLETRVDLVENKLNERVNTLEEKFYTKLEAIDAKLTTLQVSGASLTTSSALKVVQFDSEMADMRTRMALHATRIEKLERSEFAMVALFSAIVVVVTALAPLIQSFFHLN